ncbi:hypothetical protein LINPERPRIM_LOCUS11268 [Linum perenne]
MGRAAFFSAGSMRGTGDIGGFTLLVELWALERFPRIVERYIHGGVPPVDDTVPRGARWLPIIERHQHRVAMHLQDIRYAFDLCTDFVVWFPTISLSTSSKIFWCLYLKQQRGQCLAVLLSRSRISC